jgi:hypothetical protein
MNEHVHQTFAKFFPWFDVCPWKQGPWFFEATVVEKEERTAFAASIHLATRSPFRSKFSVRVS